MQEPSSARRVVTIGQGKHALAAHRTHPRACQCSILSSLFPAGLQRIGLYLCLLLLAAPPASQAQSSPVSVEAVGNTGCKLDTTKYCRNYDAIVFVHGIYGGRDTFTNSRTKFDWPAAFPRFVANRDIDVYMLNYETALLNWARDTNPSFSDIATAVVQGLKPLRTRQYRSIGFIAHSLGGNVVSTYIHLVFSEFGLPQRSQHAFIITLGTPVMGAQIANIAGRLKWALGMRDPLLESLKKNNLFLEMLQSFREKEIQQRRPEWYDCRFLNLHAAFEQKEMGLFKVVDPDSAKNPIVSVAASPIRGFDLDHSQIARPDSLKHEVAEWVMGLIRKEYSRLAKWDLGDDPARPTLCRGIKFKPED